MNYVWLFTLHDERDMCSYLQYGRASYPHGLVVNGHLKPAPRDSSIILLPFYVKLTYLTSFHDDSDAFGITLPVRHKKIIPHLHILLIRLKQFEDTTWTVLASSKGSVP